MTAAKIWKSRALRIVAVVAALFVFAAFAIKATAQQGPPPKDEFSGVVTLDQNGEATIVMPAAVMAQEKNFAYTATALGASSSDLYLKSELQNDRFIIAGGTPGQQVTWHLFAERMAP